MTPKEFESAVFSASVRSGDPDAIAKVVDAVEANHGVLAAAAEDLGVCTRTLRRWRRHVPKLARALKGYEFKPGRKASE